MSKLIETEQNAVCQGAAAVGNWELLFNGCELCCNVRKFNLLYKTEPIVNATLLCTQKFIMRLAIFKCSYQNIRWIIKKAREFQKSIYFCFIDYVLEIRHIREIEIFLVWPGIGWSRRTAAGGHGVQKPSQALSSQIISYSICDLNYITQPHWKMGTSVWCDVLSRVLVFATPWTVACQALLSLGFSRQEFWCCLPFSSPGYLPDPGIKLTSLAPPALAGRFSTTEPLYDLPPKTAMITQCL